MIKGQQIRLPVDSTSTSSQQLSQNVCNCRTKSVQILTPSQEKDESELWQSSDNKDNKNNKNNVNQSFSTKYCAKCDKLLVGTDFQFNNSKDDNYCIDCDLENNTCFGHNSQYHQQNVITSNATDNLSLYSIHMAKDFRSLLNYCFCLNFQ